MSERSETIIYRFIMGSIGAFMLFCVFMTGVAVMRDAIWQDAIEHGVGRYTINEKTGESKFEWIRKEAENADRP